MFISTYWVCEDLFLVLLADSLQELTVTGLEVRFSPFCCQLIVFTDTGLEVMRFSPFCCQLIVFTDIGLEVMRFSPFCCQLIVFTDTGPPSEHHFPPNSARFGNATEGHSLSQRSCPTTRSAPSERSGY